MSNEFDVIESAITSEGIISDFGEFLGKGKSGTVHSLKSRPKEAVKEIRTDGFSSTDLECFEENLRMLSFINHPNIIKYLWTLHSNGFIYIGMKQYHSTLSSLIIKHKREKKLVAESRILIVIRQIASALAYLHDSSKKDVDGHPVPIIIHRDLKPNNVLINEQEMQSVITDIGLSQEALCNEPGAAVNSAYLAPEVILAKRYSPGSDMWSLGVIIYELVTLAKPSFTEDNILLNTCAENWKVDLSMIKNKTIRKILEQIFVFVPEERISAIQLVNLLNEHDSPTEHKLEESLLINELIINNRILMDRCSSLEASLSQFTNKNQVLAIELESLKFRCNEYASQLLKCNEKIAILKRSTSITDPIIGLAAPTKLMFAVRHNDLDAIKVLISKGIEIGNCDEERMTALMIAAQQGYTEAVRLLADKECGAQDISGRTALMHAVIHGHLHAAEILLEYEKGIKDKREWNALLLAITKGYTEIAKLLLPYEAKDLGWTNLICAAILGDIEAAKNSLHETGERDIIGLTALIWAIQKGNIEIVQLLMEYEAGIHDLSGRTAIAYAIATKNDTVIELLLKWMKETAGWTPLMCAAATGDVDMVKQCLDDRDARDTNGDTALIIAARAGYKELVEIMDPTDERGITALMRAAIRNDIRTLCALLPLQTSMKTASSGEYISEEKRIKFDEGSTALMFSVQCSNIQAIKELVVYEGGIQSKSNYTALMYATWADNPEIVSILVDKEAGLQSKYGYTALMYAARNCYAKVASILAEKEAGLKNNSGCTALMLAAESGHAQIVSLLKEKEATNQDKYGCTALMRAVCKGKIEIVELLAGCEKGIQTSSKWCGFQPGITALAMAKTNGRQNIADILSLFSEEECEDYPIHSNAMKMRAKTKSTPSSTGRRAKKG